MSRNLKKGSYILLILMLFLSGKIIAAEERRHEFMDVECDKIWTIKFNQPVDKNLLRVIKVKLKGENAATTYLTLKIGKDNKTVLVMPPNGGYKSSEKYIITIPRELKSEGGESLQCPFEISFVTKKQSKDGTIIYEDYYMSIEKFAKKQMNNEEIIVIEKAGSRRAELDEVKYYLNPENFMDDYGKLQFLRLNYLDIMTVEDINELLKGKGILEGKGALVLEGAKLYDINPAYLLAHMFLETGNGEKSKLANGILVKSVDDKEVEHKVTYNVYGIRAYDSNPEKFGSEFAYKQAWFTPEIAIIGGAKWIGKNYISSNEYDQNTLYSMRWNKDVMWHQYSTDIEWAYKQVKWIKKYLENVDKQKLIYEVPKYSK